MDANNEIYIALAARLGIASSAMNTFIKTQKDNKMQNMAGSPVKGKLETVTISGTKKFVAHLITQPPTKTLSSRRSLQWWKEFHGRITDLLATNANGTDKPSLLVFSQCENPHSFKIVMKLPTK
jgi:hypothetical protein